MTTNPESSVVTYWTAIPEAIRAIDGDPFGGPYSVEEFRETIEGKLIEGFIDGAGNIEPGSPTVMWLDEDDDFDTGDDGVVGYIQIREDSDSAEVIASSLAVDMTAFQIVTIDDDSDGKTYVVGGMTSLPDGGAFFSWKLFVGHDDGEDFIKENLSEDAARWIPPSIPLEKP